MKITIKIVSKTGIKIMLKIYIRNKKKISFLKISDPVKRDLIVKEYLDLKKDIRDNLLSERTGEQQLQTDLSKFYRPITETQKATAREITEELKPIKEGIEKLPQALGREEEEENKAESFGGIAKEYLETPIKKCDITFGVIKKGNHHYIGKTHVIVKDNNIIIGDDGETFKGTPGLWKLIMHKIRTDYTNDDFKNYTRLVTKTNVLHRDSDPNNPKPRGSGGNKWVAILRPIWEKKEKRNRNWCSCYSE